MCVGKLPKRAAGARSNTRGLLCNGRVHARYKPSRHVTDLNDSKKRAIYSGYHYKTFVDFNGILSVSSIGNTCKPANIVVTLVITHPARQHLLMALRVANTRPGLPIIDIRRRQLISVMGLAVRRRCSALRRRFSVRSSLFSFGP